MQSATERECGIEVLSGLVEIAKLAFVTGNVVLHESAIGKADHDSQQYVPGFCGALHLVKRIAVKKPALGRLSAAGECKKL